MSLEGAIAAHRFGLGARPGEIDSASTAPKAWLLKQLDSPVGSPQPLDGGAAFMTGAELVSDLIQYRKARQAEKTQATAAMPAPDPVKVFFKTRVAAFNREMASRFALGFTTQTPFAERLVWFWSNHFTVSALNPAAITFTGAFEREAIRPNIAGKFEDMLLASTRHPAMLLYLDNAQSVGPDSIAGRIFGKGINENLGRELMELHTLGVDGGYTQADVIALAKILTGWSIDRGGGTGNGFRYYPARHEPGDIVLRGKTYSGGEEAGIAALKDLAHDPATARHIAKKFAVQFIGDDPPPESVARLEKNFNQTGGDLRSLSEAAVNDPAAWKPGGGKVRSPIEYTTAAMRLLGWPRGGDEAAQIKGTMAATAMMGEFPFAAPSPKGWPDNSDAWSGPDALLNRIQWAKELGNRMPASLDALAVAQAGLGPLLQPDTRAAMKASVTPGDAMALLVSSPEFQRR
ncbi:MAG TPA: DUF1800 domain-containing protein [Rhizomicrobium sp.]|jgi:uncharacterized protein (DUF1800 family)|nr:DUF1800 domain-containing protein [Rhizomicrobium sp.]